MISINAQSSFSLLSQSSSLVIEGKVIEKNPFKSEKNGYIYTRNIIEVLKVFKGTAVSTIEVVTLGGTVDNETRSYCHSLPLYLETTGIFFLRKSTLFQNAYAPINNYEGFVAFKNYSGRKLEGYGHKIVYENIHRDIYTPLIKILGDPQLVNLNKHEQKLLEAQFGFGGTECVEYSIKNLHISQSNNISNSTSYYVDFDIDIRSLEDVFQLRRSTVTMEYSTTLLGENIVSSNNITATLGGDFQNYQIGLSDVANNKVEVNVQKILGQIALDVNTFDYNVYHASIYIQNFDLAGILSLTVDETYDLKTFKEQDGNEVEITCNQYNEDITITLDQLFLADITSYTETVYAGTKTLLTIEGTNLVNDFGDTEIWFRNARNGSVVEWIKPILSDYLNISSTLIEVYVPSRGVEAETGTSLGKEYAGSGTFRLVHKTNGIPNVEAEKDITVVYAVVNETEDSQTQPIFLSNNFATNGYIVTYTEAFRTLQDINGFYFKDAFERALDTWCEVSNLNYIVDENAVQTGNYDIIVDYKSFGNVSDRAETGYVSYFDEDCLIEIDNGSENHPLTIGADFINQVTIDFNSDNPVANWSAETLIPNFSISAEQIALHEIGHAHGIRHTNHLDEIMYWQPLSVYEITNEASSASNYIQDHSLNHGCGGGSYQKRTCTTGIKETINEFEIKSWYSGNEIIIISNESNLLSEVNIYNVDGQLLKMVKDVKSNEISIPFQSTNGIYFIKCLSEEKILLRKILITQK